MSLTDHGTVIPPPAGLRGEQSTVHEQTPLRPADYNGHVPDYPEPLPRRPGLSGDISEIRQRLGQIELTLAGIAGGLEAVLGGGGQCERCDCTCGQR